MAKCLIPSLNRILVKKIVPTSKTTAGILLPETTAEVVSIAVDSPYKRVSHELLPRRPARDLNNDEVNTSGTKIVELEKSNIPLTGPKSSGCAQRFSFGEKDLASDESLWSLYERWMDHYGVSRDLDEKRKRFNVFKEKAKFVHEFNKEQADKENPDCKVGLNKFSDATPEERAKRAGNHRLSRSTRSSQVKSYSWGKGGAWTQKIPDVGSCHLPWRCD